jgi:hypothetical protein
MVGLRPEAQIANAAGYGPLVGVMCKVFPQS